VLPASRAGAVDGGQACSEQLLRVIELPPGAAGGLRPVVLILDGMNVQLCPGGCGDGL